MPRSRETEIYLPRRTFGAKARDKKDLVLRVKMEKGDGEWRYDEDVSCCPSDLVAQR